VLATCIAVWSLMTAACGVAQTYAQLLLARSLVAVAESGAVPTSQALASDVFPPHRRATVFGILTAAGSVGVSVGLYAGGWIADAFDWRTAFLVVGGPGLLLALLLRFTIPEPSRHAAEGAKPASGTLMISLRQLLAERTFRWLVLSSAVSGFTTYALVGWTPTFFVRAHGMSVREAGAGLAIASLLGPVAGHVLAGVISDRLAVRDLRWYAWFAALGNLVAVPSGLFFLFVADSTAGLVGYGVMMLFKSAWLAPVYAIAFRVSAPHLRAQASAVLTSCIILTGLGLGPLFVGAMNDALAGTFGTGSIRYSLAAVVLILLPGCLVFMAIARSIGRRSDDVAA
jgi:predicted MFS family arabinose efflux permease